MLQGSILQNKPELSSHPLFVFRMCHAYGLLLLLHDKENNARMLRLGSFSQMLNLHTKSERDIIVVRLQYQDDISFALLPFCSESNRKNKLYDQKSVVCFTCDF